MRGTNIITINGRPYDAVTGMPIKTGDGAFSTSPQAQPHTAAIPSAPKQPAAHKSAKHHAGRVMSDIGPRPATPPVKPTAPTHASATTHKSSVSAAAHHVHKSTQRSQTLHRATLKKPVSKHQPTPQTAAPVHHSPMINKFAAHAPATPVVPSTPHVAPAAGPTHTAQHHSAHSAATHKKQEALKGKELKEHLIKEQLRQVNTDPKEHHKPVKHRQKRHSRIASITASIAALVVLGGYLTYLNLPSLSIRVAASQAGVDASYPTYQPSGYSFTGPVAFSPGEVRVNFASNTNDYDYSLVQRASSWDSQAVLDNYVTKETEQYATLQERGLTIYLMENKAAWVNGGVFYTIEGDAPLSSEQIQKIASSTL